jgi:phosphopantothenoylcysteine decarboxylase/phosphopantothenate--cysteine ligase
VEGDMACGEYGFGRMSEVVDIVTAVIGHFEASKDIGEGPLSGLRALVTSGPTHEAIDPVRYIANRSSGKQGHAIAVALAALGADTTLVSGPTNLEDPAGMRVVRVQSARDMLAACQAALPADIAVCAAAVADWRVASEADQKMKKDGGGPPNLVLTENPDILKTLSAPDPARPGLVIGFAAETDNVVENARAKIARKQCDWILANDVSSDSGVFGGDLNTIHFIAAADAEAWPKMSKLQVAEQLAARVARHFKSAS